MNSLADLIKRDNITAHWFWTHEVSTGPYSEYEVWDVVFVRNTNEPQLWVTDADTRRTAHFRGITGREADSRRQTGGQRREPGTTETLSDLLSSAINVDNYPTFREWAEERCSDASAWKQHADYVEDVASRDQLRVWLGDCYDEYVTAYS